MKNNQFKNKLSIILFGLSFLIAVLGEAYLLNSPAQDLFSIIGIGIVVILTGYLWFDSVWDYISKRNQKILQLWELWDEVRRQDAEKRDLEYTELLNIQKATYSALKKNIKKTEEDLNNIIILLEKINEKLQAYQDKAELNNTSNTSTKENVNEIKPIRIFENDEGKP